jgi:serine/threonine protein kinase
MRRIESNCCFCSTEIVDSDFKFPRNGKVLKGADVWSLGTIFYMMLTGLPPFEDENDDVVLEKVLLGKYEWPSDIEVSAQAKDLISKMLTLDHTKRITAADALNHPWITNNNNSSVSLNAMKTFSWTWTATVCWICRS